MAQQQILQVFLNVLVGGAVTGGISIGLLYAFGVSIGDIFFVEPFSDPEREAVVAFYEATGGPEWKNNDLWLSENPLREWYGIRQVRAQTPMGLIDDSYIEYVAELILENNGLKGQIPSELGNLPNLRELRLSGNQLTGFIPPELGNLSELRFIRLAGNQLVGCIPDRLRSVPDDDFHMVDLDFCGGGRLVPPGSTGEALVALYNATGGRKWSDDTYWLSEKPFSEWNGVDTRTFSLGEVTELDLSGNSLSRELPPELGDLQWLKQLDLSDNKLSGEVPPELGQLTRLENLYLGWNQFVGCIPESLRSVPENDLPILGLPLC